tara:strand:+ start:1020 stop:1214 length:195 start_codon:yes stop_codon:yes gene_type:complete
MNKVIKSVRHIQLKKIAYTPNLYKAVVYYESHSTEYDESDDLEYQKNIMEKMFKLPSTEKNGEI